MEHDGQSNFAIWLLDDEGNRVSLLVNEIGLFFGSTAVQIRTAGVFILDISADRNWEIDIEQPAPIPRFEPPFTLKGFGQKASEFFELDSGLTVFQMTHDGESNFAIWLRDGLGNRVELLVNEIGEFDGSTAVGIRRAGVYLLDISADGPWQVDIEQ